MWRCWFPGFHEEKILDLGETEDELHLMYYCLYLADFICKAWDPRQSYIRGYVHVWYLYHYCKSDFLVSCKSMWAGHLFMIQYILIVNCVQAGTLSQGKITRKDSHMFVDRKLKKKKNKQTKKLATALQTPRSQSVHPPLCWVIYLTFCLPQLSCCCVSCVLVGFALFLVQLTGAHVFRALVVVWNESQINAACCHMRLKYTSNTEQMDTRVWLLEKYFPLMLQTPVLLSVREKKVHWKKNIA